ncbi:hypothetical protein GCM10027567_18510 [Spongiibacter taiwanensis]
MQIPRKGVGQGAGGLFKIIGGAQHIAGPLYELLASRGQHDAFAMPLKQRQPKLFLEFHYLTTEGRLAHKAGVGSAAKMLVLGHGIEILEVAQFYHRFQL